MRLRVLPLLLGCLGIADACDQSKSGNAGNVRVFRMRENFVVFLKDLSLNCLLTFVLEKRTSKSRQRSLFKEIWKLKHLSSYFDHARQQLTIKL